MRSVLYVLFVTTISYYSLGVETKISWGSHKGPNSVLTDILDRPSWDANPSTVQLLRDFAGTALLNSTGGPTTTPAWSEGDLIELGFFANDLGSDSAIGGTGGAADTPSTSLFQGTWVALTSQTYIGQDWSSDTSGSEKIDDGDFQFLTKFSKSGSTWGSSVVHNNTDLNNDDPGYKISESPTDLSEHLSVLTSSTKIGIRFYDLDTAVGAGGGTTPDSDGTTRYNTIMNTNWVWPGAGNDLEMFLHHSTNEDNLDSNLVLEFDNTTYGSAGTYTAKVAGTNVSSHGTANALHSDDFKTSITYWNGSSDLTIAGSSQDTILSGASGSANISGGNDNLLTLNVNGVGTTSNSYTLTGNIQDTGATGGLKILKVGTGEQVLTGDVNMVSDTDSHVIIGEGTLTLKSSSNQQQFEYFTGAGTLKLDNSNNASHTVSIGLANTSAKQTFAGNVELAGTNTYNALNVGGGELSGFDKHQEFSGVVSGGEKLVKTGSGKLTLSGNNTFTGGVSIADGGGTKDGGALVAGHNNALGTGTTTIEHGKLSIGAGVTISTTSSNKILGQASNGTGQKSVIGGGVGNTVGVISNNADSIINIGSGDGEIDVLSPGMAHASSMSNGTSDYQVVAGNHDASGTDDLTLSIGTIQIDKIGLKNGGVFDWEITDFAGDNSGGSDWDVLKFDTLNFDATNDTFDINIYSLASDGSAGGVTVDGSNHLYSSKTGTSGFKFMEWTGSGTPNGTTEGWLGDQTAREVTAFNINSDSWAYHNNFYYGDWSVWYESGSFYLQYSAVPEPSTYFMVTGLLMLPGYNFLRRIRKKKSLGDVEDITDNA
jgi:autotransporter-associated beta strand protein